MSTAETLSQPPTHGLFVDGQEVPGSSGETLDVLNPATGEVIAKTAHGSAQDIDVAIRSARRAFEGKEWGGMDVRARAPMRWRRACPSCSGSRPPTTAVR